MARSENLTTRLLSDCDSRLTRFRHREAPLVAVRSAHPSERAGHPGVSHPHSWQVRCIGRAADPSRTSRRSEAAYDDNDNVREATLVPLQRIAGVERSQPAFIAALGRRDYQLVRTAAIGVKGQTSDKYVVSALVEALVRITAENSDTSRDTRLALMERLREAGRAQAPVFEKLLTDFDPRCEEARRR